MRFSLRRLAILTSLCAVLLVLGSGATAGGARAAYPSNGTPALAKLHGSLGTKATQSSAAQRFRVIVHLKAQADLRTWPANDRAGAIHALQNVAATTQPAARTFLAQVDSSANVYQTYWIFNGFAVEAPLAAIQALAARDDVDYIVEDGVVTQPAEPLLATAPSSAAANWNIYQVNAPQTWALGYDGTGRTVANLDSGVDGAHQAFVSRWRGILPGHTAADSWLDPFNISANFPTATGDHGTHTMGTIAGYFGDATGTNEIGQAKGAAWIACRIYDNSGKGPFSYIHACFQFMVDPDGNPNTNDQPDAVGNSWSDTSANSYPDLEWWPDVLAWRAVGIMPIFSNGNYGPGVSTVSDPGSYPISIGIGAVDINRNIAGFSSRGPAENLPPWNDQSNWERSDWNRIKPEVVAPGVNVRSSLSGNTYGNLSGTSMASPHVTGLGALLRQIRPDLTINEFYNIIIDTAFFSPTWGTRPNNNYGWGEIDDYAAAVYVRDAGAVAGTIMDSSCAVAVSGVDVRVYDNTPGSRAQGVGIRKLVSDNTGHYRTILASGQYTVSITAPGYYGMDYTTSVLSSTTTTLPIMLTKMASGQVSGIVTDGTNPVAGAEVVVDGLPNVHATTNAQGQYTLAAVPDGTFTMRAEACGYTGGRATIQVIYPNPLTQNFVLASPSVFVADDFESGNLNNWIVTGGGPTTAIWDASTIRAHTGIGAARAGAPGQPIYTGTVDTYLTTANPYDASAADRVWLSFYLYDSAESEYDILRGQVSSDGGTSWTTVFGQASPVHGWQSVCLDLTTWKSASMKVRFYFHADASNWNGEIFEGPSLDEVRFTASTGGPTPSPTTVPAMTPTPGATIPCTPIVVGTATPTVGATATPCPVQFQDVPMGSTFYDFVRCLACRGIVGGYPCGGPGEPCPGNYFRPNNNVTRGQVSKIVSESAAFANPIPSTQWTFQDVPTNGTFWLWVERLSGRGIIGGYPCGGALEPCVAPGNKPYFRPNNDVTRGQLSKIVSGAAGWTETPTGQTFADVAPGSTFWLWIERVASRGIVAGYPCGGTGEPCIAPGNKPYFRPFNNATRGQMSKIASSAFFPGCSTPTRR